VLADNPLLQSNERERRRRLRSGVLRLGSLLGMDRCQVTRLAEAVTGCPWRRCGCVQLEEVIAEYRGMVVRVMARQRYAETQRLQGSTRAPVA
jgi:hypothetical protein